ncbi:MAG: sodium:solute symporter family protein [Chitinophagaceae bacterium]|nr:MAG: sodium:solute symporter family protein [Chitinophagaceae bacterium]
MHIIDLSIFIIYMIIVLGVGYYFMRKNTSEEDYYVGGRNIGKWHIGLSVVATDVGGGFSIGLGGLGFVMGLSGSWMLFTGLVGAWLSAVFLIPKVKKIEQIKKLFTLPEVFGHYYGPRVALLAGIISAVGYLGFTSSQVLAGAKLASASFVGLDLNVALYIMGFIVIVYTAMGGIKAVIYTDTAQWILLLSGLIFIGIPVSYYAVGGWESIQNVLAPEFFTLTNISWQQLLNWAVTIIPIWFVGMTLYQRIYASRSEKEAKQAWYIAGLFEWPIMAFMGVTLGLLARVAFEQNMFAPFGFESALGVEGMDVEMGLPLLLRAVLPVGLMGLMLAAYFSAIMSTADSCLVASSGNTVSDILKKFINIKENSPEFYQLSQVATLVLGVIALLIASVIPNVLELMLLSYAFMVSGLLVPVVGAMYWKKSSAVGAFLAMLSGGATTLILSFSKLDLPFGLDANIFGISAALLIFVIFSLTFPNKNR